MNRANTMANKRRAGMTVHGAMAVVNESTGGATSTTAPVVVKPIIFSGLAVIFTLKVASRAHSGTEPIDQGCA
jgi:hypothetical protein